MRVPQESRVRAKRFFQTGSRSMSMAMTLAPRERRTLRGPIAEVAPRRTKYFEERSSHFWDVRRRMKKKVGRVWKLWGFSVWMKKNAKKNGPHC